MLSSRPILARLLFWSTLVVVWVGGVWGYLHWVVWPGVDAFDFDAMGRTFEILEPQFFGLLLTLPILAVVSRFSLSDLPRYQRILNLGMRTLVVTAIVASMVQVVVTDFESRVSTIFLVDTSASFPDEAHSQALDFINDTVDEKGESDDVQVIAFADRPYLVEPGADGEYTDIPRANGDDEEVYDTDISAAMRMAYGLFPDDHLKRAVLVTDGNETHGDFLAEVNRAADAGVRLFSHTIDYEMPPEVLIQSFEAPESIDIGAPFQLTARIFSTHDDTVDLTLWQDEYRDDEKTIDVEEGITEVQFETEVSESGFREFQLEMDVHGRDTHQANNRAIETAWVDGEPRVLYIEGEMRARHYLERALGDEDFDVETRSPAGIPTTTDELDDFDLVILSDVHADDVSTEQMKLLEAFVRQGGGLVKAGGEDAFGAGGWRHTPVEDLMPVTFETQERHDTPSLAVLLVIDRSGSMSEHRRMELAREAARAAVRELDDEAEIGILSFDHEVDVVSPIQPVTNRARILNQIDRIQIRGGTDIALALEEAYDKMVFNPARVRHVILLTDGISPEDNIFTETMPAMRIEDITVTTVAVGQGAETSLMRRVAEAGNGRFYFTNRPYDVPQIFIDETRAVAESALVEEPVGTEVTGRAQFLEGVDWARAPYLMGYVSTTPRPEADVVLSTDTGEPLLAHWRVGLGQTVAFTSDLKNRWGVNWVRWSGYPQLWAQLVRSTMRTDDTDRLPMRAELDQDRGRAVVDAIDSDDRFINDLDSRLRVEPPQGDVEYTDFDQIAPGRFEATFDLGEFGSYELTAEHKLDDQPYAESRASLAYPYPRGLSFTEPNTELVERAVDVADGTIDPSPEALFDPEGEEIRYRRHLWPYFAALALLLLLVDLGLRRIRLSGSTDVTWDQLIDPR